MIEEDPRESILVAGLDDWVSLAEAQGYVSDAMPGVESSQLRRATINAIEQMLMEELLEVGQLAPRFTPWTTTPRQTIAKLRSEWIVTDVEKDHGFDWWLCLTARGEQTARALEFGSSQNPRR